MDTITINKKDIIQYKNEGSKLIFKKDAESSLLRLLEAKDFIDSQIEEVKKLIADAGLSISSDFKGVIGEKVKAIFRTYGVKYKIINDREARKFIKTVISESVDSDLVDEYLKTHKELPPGIAENERIPVISISIKK